MDDHKKKSIVLFVSSIMLVVMVIAFIYVNMDTEDHTQVDDVSASKKAISTICDTTDYKETCIKSLTDSGTNSSDPRELIDVVFQAAIRYIDAAANKSTLFQNLEKDPRAKSALDTCDELARRSITDLQRSLAKFKSLDIIAWEGILMDLKIWISGAITHQETCVDGFQGVPGDAGQRMRDALETSMKMSSNVLALVEELATYLQAMGSSSSNTRRLLSMEDGGHHTEFPEWMEFNTRRLLTASTRQIRPNLIVAKDGSGKHMTVNAALKDIPARRPGVFVLYIKQGVYEENVKIDSSLTNLLIIGDGPNKTRITGKLNYIDGINTYHTATVAVHGDGFIARNIGFENTAGAVKHQAVALRVSADKAIFHNCHMDGYQDTLYTHAYRQFYRSCVISGTIDFIFGDGAVVFQGCTMLVRKPLDNQQCIVTAQGRKDLRQPTGLVLQNCTIKATEDYYAVKGKIRSYLGRPWKLYSRTIVMESFLDDLIQPEGWMPWDGTFALNTLFYTEFNNRGPAAPKTERVKWPGVKELPPGRIKRFTAADFLDGNRWIPMRKVPYSPGFIYPVPKEDPNINYSPIVPEETKDLGSEPIIIPPKMEPPKMNLTGSAPAPEISSPVSVPETLIVASPVASPIANPVFIPLLDVGIAAPPAHISPDFVPAPAPQPDYSPAAGSIALPPDLDSYSPASAPGTSIAASPDTSPTGSPNTSPAMSPSSSNSVLAPAATPQSSNGESFVHNAPAPSPIGDSSSFGSFEDEAFWMSAFPHRPSVSDRPHHHRHHHHHHHHQSAGAPSFPSLILADALI